MYDLYSLKALVSVSLSKIKGILEIWKLSLYRPNNLYVSLDIIAMADEFVAQCVKIYFSTSTNN